MDYSSDEHQNAAQSSPGAPGTQEQPEPACVLVIDDQPTNLDVLRAILSRVGHEAILAETGEAGLLLAQERAPDLILLDVVLPDIDGYEVCARLKADARTADIPVIFISVLEEVEDKIRAFTAGGVDYVPKPFSTREVQARVGVHLALRRAQEGIRRHNEQLEREVARRRRVEEMLRQLTQTLEAQVLLRTRELRALNVRLTEVEEEERRRLAAILHDHVGQNLTALDVNLRILCAQMLAAVDDPATADQLSTRLDDSLDLVKQVNQEIREVTYDLRPPTLERYGLLEALRWYGEAFAARTRVAVTVQGPEAMPRLSPLSEITLFRIAQEALTNVARHAQAGRATVTLEMTVDTARLVVADDGVGFDPATLEKADQRPSWGLQLMVERAEAMGGTCRVESSPGEGTQVFVEVKR